MARIISGDTYTQMVKNVQNCERENEFKSFLKALIDEIPIARTAGKMAKDDKRFYVEDLIECLERTIENGTENFWIMDTALRDYFLDAIMKG